jgi:inorganic pyrophosphatase/exopolyphosphatase
MKDVIYVTGHKNPDSDSICTASPLAVIRFLSFIPKKFDVNNEILIKIMKRYNELLENK